MVSYRTVAIAPALFFTLALSAEVVLADEPEPADHFEASIRPVLEQFCSDCHHPEDSENKVLFLKASTAEDVADSKRLWNNVATQLRNRTMPPADQAQPTEADRLRIANWIDEWLRETACSGEEYAGSITARRLNRREYDRTIRELFGIELNFAETFPREGSGGEGFDNNGETLFLPPILLERYLEAAQRIVDAAIVTPPVKKVFSAGEFMPQTDPQQTESRVLEPGDEVTVLLPVFEEGGYTVSLEATTPSNRRTAVILKIDGIRAHRFQFGDNPASDAKNKPNATLESFRQLAQGLMKGQSDETDDQSPPVLQTVVRLTRGLHAVSLKSPSATQGQLAVTRLRISENRSEPTAEELRVHRNLLGLDVGEVPGDKRAAAQYQLARFLKKAFRRPVTSDEIERYMAFFDRSVERGDPYEESIKLALKGVLVAPDFLFRIEREPTTAGIQPITDHELATRLSYFLWETMPDAELTRLADEGRLHEESVLLAQVDRMLDDPKSRAFAETFIGQWLGTKDVGGRVAPTANDIQDFYTPEIAADMREEPIRLFQHMLAEDRSVLEFLDADYTFLTRRLAKFYRMEDVDGLSDREMRFVQLPDKTRGGLLGLGGVLAMTSHHKQTSPVLRGAWILETVLGSPVPTPPPDVPPLDETEDKEDGKELTVREKLLKHRENPTCAACHDLMDPIGFGLENFDYLGRWREDDDGQPLDVSGLLPSGESFNGPAELKQVLLKKKREFLRQLVSKTLGYALGRSLLDADQCTIETLIDELENSEFRARALVRAVVLSTPFRYCQAVEGPKTTAQSDPQESATEPQIEAGSQ